MATSDVQLKHLSFVKMVAINAAVLVSNLYGYAKHNSGPLKSTLGKVEHAVTAALGPLYSKFKGVPTHILVFFDNKVEEATYVFDKRAPATAKNVVRKARSMVKTASELVREVKEEGAVAGICHAAKISKDFTASQLVMVWYKANEYSFVHGVLEAAIPKAAHLSEKYNSLVKGLAAKGWCSLFSYVPLVPLEEMKKAADSKKAPDTSSGSDSDKEE